MSLENYERLNKFLCLFALVAAAFSTQLTRAELPPAAGETLTLSWNANPEPDVQAYRVYVGTQSGAYLQTYDAGTATYFPIDQLQAGQTYYFAVVAIGGSGLESPLSAELAVTIATPPLPTDSQVAAGASGELNLQWTFPASAMGSSPDFNVQASSDLVNWTQVATVAAGATLGGDGQLEHFSWPIPAATEQRMFYRLTATNWLGSSIAP